MKCNIIPLQILFVLLNEYLNKVCCELGLPIIVEGPMSSNEINHDLSFNDFIKLPYNIQDGEKSDSEPKPIIENVDIKSNITKRLDKTTIKCLVKNPSIRNAQEIEFSIELPYTNYHITNTSFQIVGDDNIFIGKNKVEAEVYYNKFSKRKQSAVFIKELKKNVQKSYQEAKMLSMKISIPAGEKLLLTMEYEGPLIKNGNGTLNHIVHVNPHQLVQNFNINVYINDTLPITDVRPFEVRNQWPTFKYSTMKMKQDAPQYIHVSFIPNESVEKGMGYDMNGQFHTSYTPNKNYLLSKVGQDIMDMADFESLAEFERFGDEIGAMFEFMFHILWMIPFIVLTQVTDSFFLIISMVLGFDSTHLLEPRWYQHELEKEFAKMDAVFGIPDNSWTKLDDDFGSFNKDVEKFKTKWDSKWDNAKVTDKTKWDAVDDRFKVTEKKSENKFESFEDLKKSLKDLFPLDRPKKNIFMEVSHVQRPKTVRWSASHSGSFKFGDASKQTGGQW